MGDHKMTREKEPTPYPVYDLDVSVNDIFRMLKGQTVEQARQVLRVANERLEQNAIVSIPVLKLKTGSKTFVSF